MGTINIVFPDGASKEFPIGTTGEDIAQSISPGLRRQSIAIKLDGEYVDLRRELTDGGSLEIITERDEEGLEIMRHSTAHVLAQAVKRLYPEAKFGVGPVIDNGFYYDIELDESLTPEDLPKIEKEMERIVNENLEFTREVVSREEAREMFEDIDDHLKLELLEDIPEDEEVSIYKQGEFFDLCRGVHVPQTSKIKAFKLLEISGAYWRGDSDNQMLQRIYGTAFFKQKDLDRYLEFMEEAKKRDHRKLGRELDLFMFSEEAPGMPFYLPKGQHMRNELEQFSRELQDAAGYDEVRTPIILNQQLWEQSGHWDHYQENMYFTDVDKTSFALKPMNCPGHMLIFNSKLHSYRDLPIRMAEFGLVHRHEYSGALNGLLRVRSFTQDDAHIFVRPDQIESEIKNIYHMVNEIYETFGFDYTIELSTRPEDSMGADELWEHAESSLEKVLQDLQLDYELNEGDGAFYGPKIDFHIEDAIGRSHQCATIQLDFQMPENFDLTYIDEQNERVRPVVIHRAIYGSIDRFLGILIEHFAGAFPTWLAPEQVRVIPVSVEAHMDYAMEVISTMQEAGIRVHLDHRNEKLSYKIREAQTKKVPYALVLGDKEMEAGTVNVRKYGEKKTETISLEEFIENVQKEIESRSL
ncbi:MAG TPA: threonine--tRNA ligase [Bacillota bacterium]|nr:threonine--tRNA ligase [Bacillota bacterium]